jgi:enamine deaminase RidA (YjgF/YER057c/UK114 family)
MKNDVNQMINFAGEIGFLNGLLPVHLSDPNVFLPESVEAQARKIIKNLDELLAVHHLTISNVIAVQVFLKDFHRFYARFDAISNELFGQESCITKNVVGVQALPRDALVSMNFVIQRKI